MHVEQLFFAVIWPQIRKKYYKYRPSVTKGCKTSKLKFRFQVQVPTTVNELRLCAYNSLICYRLSDDGVSRLRSVKREKSAGALVAGAGYIALSC